MNSLTTPWHKDTILQKEKRKKATPAEEGKDSILQGMYV